MPVEGKGPQFRQTQMVRDWRLGNLATPKSVQKLQTALHAKRSGGRRSLLRSYDKISRDDFWRMPCQCRSTRRAGHRGQNFADIEAYGVERWLAELALALRQRTYRPSNQTSVYTKANGKTQAAGHLERADRSA